ncbi:MAG: ABC transporter permease [Thermogutta sp.]|nr:ABC transporter permease [Thermogutta sp.]
MPRFARSWAVFLTFARNSLIRDMTFRANFLLELASSLSWVFMNLGFYLLIFSYTPSIGAGTGWGKWEFFAFVGTGLIINSLTGMFFMTNGEEFGEMIRTGTLDFALLKPIDTQFLVSLQRVEWSGVGNLLVGIALVLVSATYLKAPLGVLPAALYGLFVLCGVVILYSLLFSFAAMSVWLGRNTSLLDFWFYIVSFSRYPMEIYQGPLGRPIRRFFSFVLPVLVAVNVPARVLVRPLYPQAANDRLFALTAPIAAIASFAVCRWVFVAALRSYRSASS